MSEQPPVADYIVRRLAREGITDRSGVVGEFAFSGTRSRAARRPAVSLRTRSNSRESSERGGHIVSERHYNVLHIAKAARAA
jgi:hypothetical protein